MDPRRPLDAAALRAALGARWARVAVVAETASTNADLVADTSAPDHSVLVAENQTAGRGRLERAWISRPGTSLTFSVLLRPAVPLAQWGWLPLLAGVAGYEAVVAVSGVSAALKWPNDLLAGTGPEAALFGKVGGILAQTSGEAAVVGFGINVATAVADLPVESATSLALCGAPGTDRLELLVAILTRLDARCAEWVATDGDAEACGLATAYTSACATVGQVVAVTATNGRIVRGSAVGVDSGGRLQLAVDGAVEVIGAGDVAHLRPA